MSDDPRSGDDRCAEPLGASSKADTMNPKDLQGLKKVSLTKLPAVAQVHGAHAMMNGAERYGPYNWRAKKVIASIYVDAALRHLGAWFEGEEAAADSGVHHLGHAIACCAILLDAQETGNLVDDRPVTDASRGVLSRVLERLKAPGVPAFVTDGKRVIPNPAASVGRVESFDDALAQRAEAARIDAEGRERAERERATPRVADSWNEAIASDDLVWLCAYGQHERCDGKITLPSYGVPRSCRCRCHGDPLKRAEVKAVFGERCPIQSAGYERCTRAKGHDGPCAHALALESRQGGCPSSEAHASGGKS